MKNCESFVKNCELFVKNCESFVKNCETFCEKMKRFVNFCERFVKKKKPRGKKKHKKLWIQLKLIALILYFTPIYEYISLQDLEKNVKHGFVNFCELLCELLWTFLCSKWKKKKPSFSNSIKIDCIDHIFYSNSWIYKLTKNLIFFGKIFFWKKKKNGWKIKSIKIDEILNPSIS